MKDFLIKFAQLRVALSIFPLTNKTQKDRDKKEKMDIWDRIWEKEKIRNKNKKELEKLELKQIRSNSELDKT